MDMYVYRTTAEKVETSSASVRSSGDTVISAHHVVGRDWVLLCRKGSDRLVSELTVPELDARIKRVLDALEKLASLSTSKLFRAGA